MESCKQKATDGVQNVQKRFIFCVEKDTHLLQSAIGVNPFQLGKSKWEDVSKDLKTKYGYSISARAARERVENFLKKYKTDELKSKTGTEEQGTLRGDLLVEIITIIESKEAAINEELGADTDTDIVQSEEVNDGTPRATQKRGKQSTAANQERDNILKQNYTDATVGPNTSRAKRLKTHKDEDLIEKKMEHEMEMDRKRFALEQEMKRANILNKQKRLEIELVREKRMAEEAVYRQELLEGFHRTVKTVVEILKKQT